MKTQKVNAAQIFFKLILSVHHKTSSMVAKIIGPAVFNYGTIESGWNMTTADLQKFPHESLGKMLGEFLTENKLEPLSRAEYHDVHHVLFNYSISLKDEVALQFFLHGNGRKSIASYLTCFGAWCILPFHWKYLRASYEKGKNCKDFSALNLKTVLHQNYNKVKAHLFNEI